MIDEQEEQEDGDLNIWSNIRIIAQSLFVLVAFCVLVFFATSCTMGRNPLW